MYITGIDQAILELISFKVDSGNHQRGISFGNPSFQILKIEIFSKLCKI